MYKLMAVCGCLLVVGTGALVYTHKDAIKAVVKGEKMPEAPEWAKKFCPPLRKKAQEELAEEVEAEGAEEE